MYSTEDKFRINLNLESLNVSPSFHEKKQRNAYMVYTQDYGWEGICSGTVSHSDPV